MGTSICNTHCQPPSLIFSRAAYIDSGRCQAVSQNYIFWIRNADHNRVIALCFLVKLILWRIEPNSPSLVPGNESFFAPGKRSCMWPDTASSDTPDSIHTWSISSAAYHKHRLRHQGNCKQHTKHNLHHSAFQTSGNRPLAKQGTDKKLLICHAHRCLDLSNCEIQWNITVINQPESASVTFYMLVEASYPPE